MNARQKLAQAHRNMTPDEIGFTGLAAVELPRHDHDPVHTATRAIEYFRRFGPVR